MQKQWLGTAGAGSVRMALALLGCLAGCSDKGGGVLDDSASDTGSGAVAPPCAGGTWGAIDPAWADTGFHVSASGAEGGDGSGARPFTSVDDAIAASRAEGAPKAVLLWPGTYPVSLDLGADLGDDTLRIQGCSAGEVILQASSADVPVIKVSAGQGLDIRGVTVSGGKRGLWVWQGATVTVHDLHAVGNGLLGVVIDGAATVATMSDIVVSDPTPVVSYGGGYGLVVQGAIVAVSNLTVSGASENGVLVDGGTASASFAGLTVSGTSPRSDGWYGRGMTVQQLARVSITDGTFTGNHDAGIFGLGAAALDMSNVYVSLTEASILSAIDVTSGDGIVVSDAPENGPYDARYFSASLQDVTVEGSSRAGVLFSGSGLGVTLMGTLSIAPSAADPGGGLPLTQLDALVSGGDAYALDTALLVETTPCSLDAFAP